MKIRNWITFLVIIVIIAMIPALFVFLAISFLRVTAIIICLGLIILLVVLQILGRLTLRKMFGWMVPMVVILIVAIWAPWQINWSSNTPTKSSNSSGIQEVQPKKELVFIWRYLPGETSAGGNNSLTLSVEITKNNQDSFWAVLHDTDGQGIDVSVGGLRLSKVGNDLIGEWSNYLDGDGGKCYLYKTPSGWSGHFELKNGKRPDCRLEWK